MDIFEALTAKIRKFEEDNGVEPTTVQLDASTYQWFMRHKDINRHLHVGPVKSLNRLMGLRIEVLDQRVPTVMQVI